MTAFHLDLDPHLGRRRNTSAYAQALGGTCCDEMKDILGLGWCPGSVVLPLQFSLLISYEQP